MRVPVWLGRVCRRAPCSSWCPRGAARALGRPFRGARVPPPRRMRAPTSCPFPETWMSCSQPSCCSDLLSGRTCSTTHTAEPTPPCCSWPPAPAPAPAALGAVLGAHGLAVLAPPLLAPGRPPIDEVRLIDTEARGVRASALGSGGRVFGGIAGARTLIRYM